MTVRPLTIGAAAVLGLGCLLHLIGLATPTWITSTGGSSFGFWKGCYNGICYTLEENEKEDWWKASEALALLGMIFSFGALLFAVVMIVFDFKEKEFPKGLAYVTLLGSINAAVLVIICVVVFGVKCMDETDETAFGYSFGLSIAGADLMLMGGIVTGICRLRQQVETLGYSRS